MPGLCPVIVRNCVIVPPAPTAESRADAEVSHVIEPAWKGCQRVGHTQSPCRVVDFETGTPQKKNSELIEQTAKPWGSTLPSWP